MSEKYSPCFEKNCSWCCNPVKVKHDIPESKIPIDENGQKIWKPRNEIWIPKEDKRI